MGWLREAIERCVKEQNIDRTRFFEVSKMSYFGIIQQMEDTFVDKSDCQNRGIHWANMGRIKKKYTYVAKTIKNNHACWFLDLPSMIPHKEDRVYILFEDVKAYQPKYWLYEGCVPELITVLLESYLLGDYYIFSKKFHWLISENHEDIVLFVGEGLNTDSDCFENINTH